MIYQGYLVKESNLADGIGRIKNLSKNVSQYWQVLFVECSATNARKFISTIPPQNESNIIIINFYVFKKSKLGKLSKTDKNLINIYTSERKSSYLYIGRFPSSHEYFDIDYIKNEVVCRKKYTNDAQWRKNAKKPACILLGDFNEDYIIESGIFTGGYGHCIHTIYNGEEFNYHSIEEHEGTI
jgi:hypothetical protein